MVFNLLAGVSIGAAICDEKGNFSGKTEAEEPDTAKEDLNNEVWHME